MLLTGHLNGELVFRGIIKDLFLQNALDRPRQYPLERFFVLNTHLHLRYSFLVPHSQPPHKTSARWHDLIHLLALRPFCLPLL